MLKPSQHEANLNNAFAVAEEHLGITRLLDAEGAWSCGVGVGVGGGGDDNDNDNDNNNL